ncbi:acyl-CoA dehydrogenase family protein [Streptomyces justiciae]|uniref:acyl-CoA dehydrogenase family protein n=1 Tax=Streptomyces justiciae TaxID=2780140 RepID=UPI0021186AE3|nr:acyl-CoA dehydrogenase family protein [Streptomyces justiciae]MCW8375500.1 acyl-CoA/acyl-ACP dehydrogenase [Streptomyces justiciae]
MDAGFTAEQDEIRRTLRELLHKRCGPEELRAAVDTPAGHDPALWTALAEQLGLPGLALPEAYGGIGCSATELALAAEETGRVLAPSPLLATAVLVAPLVLALGTDAQRADLLPRIASGALTAALAAPTAGLALTGDNRGDWAGGGRAGGVQARRTGTGWTLYGEVGPVPDGHSARLLLVAAHTGGFARSRTLLFLVAGDADGVVRTRHTALDATRPLGHLQLRDVEAELLGADEGTDVPAALARTGDGAAAVLACEAVGAADRVLERTVEYVKQREQFGRAIGSFQAVKHRLADVYVQVQAARSAAYYAAWATAQESGGAARSASLEGRWRETGGRVGGLALAQGLEALRSSAGEAIQLHGGIGFTWEHDVQLYFKRAAGDELLFGPVHRLRAHAADAASLFAATEVPV